MKKALIFCALYLSMNVVCTAQLSKTYHPDSLKVWTRDIFNELSDNHPGFYRYTTEQDFENRIDSMMATIDQPISTMEYYRKIKPLFAKIGCLHTGIYLSQENSKELSTHQTLLPLEIFDDRKEVFITKDYSNTIRIGTQLLAINGEPIQEIIETIKAAIPSDGYNQTLKSKMINLRFSHWYRTVIGESETFRITVENDGRPQDLILYGVKEDVFPTFEEMEYGFGKLLTYKSEGEIGYLTIQSFSKSAIKKKGQKFKKFIDETFEKIQSQGIRNLVIDVRGNTGGSDSHAVELTGHFFDKEFRYWDRIEVTESIANDIKGSVRLFYKKPIKKDSTYLWQKMWLSKEFDYYEPVQPVKPYFSGSVYILTDGFCMSSCSDFVAIMADHYKATIIGQETGGGYQGNTSGLMPQSELPMGLSMTVPLLKYTNAVDPDVNIGHGTIPDHVIDYTWQEHVDKKDLEMEFVKQLIDRKTQP